MNRTITFLARLRCSLQKYSTPSKRVANKIRFKSLGLTPGRLAEHVLISDIKEERADCYLDLQSLTSLQHLLPGQQSPVGSYEKRQREAERENMLLKIGPTFMLSQQGVSNSPAFVNKSELKSFGRQKA